MNVPPQLIPGTVLPNRSWGPAVLLITVHLTVMLYQQDNYPYTSNHNPSYTAVQIFIAEDHPRYGHILPSQNLSSPSVHDDTYIFLTQPKQSQEQSMTPGLTVVRRAYTCKKLNLYTCHCSFDVTRPWLYIENYLFITCIN